MVRKIFEVIVRINDPVVGSIIDTNIIYGREAVNVFVAQAMRACNVTEVNVTDLMNKKHEFIYSENGKIVKWTDMEGVK